jgi:glycosyltransferase involved in cell wall biosynthesis
MPSTPEHNFRVRFSYEEILRRVDVVFANCEAAKESFQPLRRDIWVVPNAAEMQDVQSPTEKPSDLLAMQGPIIGYVGNLRDRIDTDLIERIAAQHPTWNIVLIGSAHRAPEVLKLRGISNIHFLGVKQYEEAARYIRAFDVAIMPHLDNAVSRAMNPLKLYVYASLGVPIVTTAVANIDEISRFAKIASNHDDFIAHVERLVEHGHTSTDTITRDLSWLQRVDSIIDVIDQHVS